MLLIIIVFTVIIAVSYIFFIKKIGEGSSISDWAKQYDTMCSDGFKIKVKKGLKKYKFTVPKLMRWLVKQKEYEIDFPKKDFDINVSIPCS